MTRTIRPPVQSSPVAQPVPQRPAPPEPLGEPDLVTARAIAAHPREGSDPTLRFRQVFGAIALPSAFILHMAYNTIYAVISTSSGLSDVVGAAEALEMYRRFPAEITACSMLVMAGSLLAIPGLLTALRVLRPYRPRLSLWAVVMMITGYVCYIALTASPLPVALAVQNTPGAVPALESAQSGPMFYIPGVVFVLGNLVGTSLLGLAVLLSRRLPWYAGALILGWPVGHSINVFLGGGEWFAVAGGGLEVVGLTILAAIAVRTPGSSWAARG